MRGPDRATTAPTPAPSWVRSARIPDACATIPSPVFSPARPSKVAPEPEGRFATGVDLVTRVAPPPPASTPKEPANQGLPGAGVGYGGSKNPFAAQLVSPVGPAPGGSQLFEVLAQYVMAGGSGPPTGVALILLVQIATVVAAFALRTPRSMFQMILGVSDRACVGYRAVSLRPG